MCVILIKVPQTFSDTIIRSNDLCKLLNSCKTFVSRIELGERRLDVVEFYWVCRACDQDPKSIYDELLKEFAKLD